MATTPSTNINIPYSAFIDPTTGRPTQAWLLWLMSPSFINVTISGALPVTSGGTGLTTIPTNGQLLIGNGTGYTLNTLGYGSGISITNGLGTISVSNTGVLSFSGGTTGITPSTATTGDVVLSGTLNFSNGGTNTTATPTLGSVVYGTGTAQAYSAVGTSGQALLSTGSGAPIWGSVPGVPGPVGPAVFLEAQEADEVYVIPGPPGAAGVAGITGAQGPIGPAVYF